MPKVEPAGIGTQITGVFSNSTPEILYSFSISEMNPLGEDWNLGFLILLQKSSAIFLLCVLITKIVIGLSCQLAFCWSVKIFCISNKYFKFCILC